MEKIREYTRAGDVMQVVLAQRMSIPFNAPSINLYRALRSLNPSPYMYFMDLADFEIVSSSPEILARLEEAERLCTSLKGIDLFLTYHPYCKAPDWIGPRVSKALNVPYVTVEAAKTGQGFEDGQDRWSRWRGDR